MSGAEFIAVLSIGASIVQVVEAYSKILSRVQEFRQNAAFYDLSVQLSLFKMDIEAIDSPEHKSSLDSATEEALVRVLEGCRRQLDKLDRLIQSLVPAPFSSKLMRVTKGLQSVGKNSKIQEIVGVLSGYKSTISVHLASRQIQNLSVTDTVSSNAKSYFEVPAQRVSHFIGRKHFLERIECNFSKGDANPAVVVLTGAGGQGKTQIALEFCRRSSSKYKAIFWIDASAQTCATRSFERIAAKISMPNLSSSSSKEKIDYVKEALRCRLDPWLLVFDNYDAPNLFQDMVSFFPAACGGNKNAILVTSRHVSCGRLGIGMEVDGLTEDEGIELLRSRSHEKVFTDENVNESKKIVKQLGYLALAIDQAGAYLSSRQLQLQLFLDHYNKRKEYILKHTPSTTWEYESVVDGCAKTSGGNLCVLTTWELSFEQMSEDKNERQKLGSFLTQAAFFDPTNVKEALFQNFLKDTIPKCPDWIDLFCSDGVWDSFRFQDTLAGLNNLSLIQNIKITGQECKFSLHPMIKVRIFLWIVVVWDVPANISQEWLQLRSTAQDRKIFLCSAIMTTASLVEEQETESLTMETRQELLGTIDCCVANTEQHIKSLSDTISYAGFIEGYQTTFATFYGQHDRHVDAEKLFTKALVCQREHFQSPMPSLVELRTMNNLSVVYLHVKNLEKAEDMLQKTLLSKEKLLGNDHPMTMNTINNIGNLFGMQDKFSEAKDSYQKVLVGYTKIHGPEHKSVIHAMNNLGEISLKLGDLSDAENTFMTALVKAQKLSSHDNALVLYIKSNLALVYKIQAKYSESAQLYMEVIAGREILFGNEHSLTFLAKCELGDAYLAAGHTNEAEEWYTKGNASPERLQRDLQQRDKLEGQNNQAFAHDHGSRVTSVLSDIPLFKSSKWDSPNVNLTQASSNHMSASRIAMASVPLHAKEETVKHESGSDNHLPLNSAPGMKSSVGSKPTRKRRLQLLITQVRNRGKRVSVSSTSNSSGTVGQSHPVRSHAPLNRHGIFLENDPIPRYEIPESNMDLNSRLMPLHCTGFVDLPSTNSIHRFGLEWYNSCRDENPDLEINRNPKHGSLRDQATEPVPSPQPTLDNSARIFKRMLPKNSINRDGLGCMNSAFIGRSQSTNSNLQPGPSYQTLANFIPRVQAPAHQSNQQVDSVKDSISSPCYPVIGTIISPQMATKQTEEITQTATRTTLPPADFERTDETLAYSPIERYGWCSCNGICDHYTMRKLL